MSIRKSVLCGCVAAALAAVPGIATANLIVNGSFENALANWTIGGADAQGFPPAAIFYNAAVAYPNGAFGEAVPPNNAPTNSDDPVGLRAAYFVTDLATNQSLSQTVFLAAGTYQIGFSAYLPFNGAANPNDARFSGTIAGVTLADFFASTQPAGVWRTYAGSTTIAVDGNYNVAFVFNTGAAPAKDVVIDQVYIIPGNPPIGVPEPATLALLGIGLAAIGLRRREG